VQAFGKRGFKEKKRLIEDFACRQIFARRAGKPLEQAEKFLLECCHIAWLFLYLVGLGF